MDGAHLVTGEPGPALERCSGARLRELERSVRRCGFAAWPGAVLPRTLYALQAEAEATLGSAVLAEQSGPLSYRANIASLGPTAAGLLRDRRVGGLLGRLFGPGRYSLSEQVSCLTFYGEGDRLGAHVDEPASACSVTAILYLEARSPRPGTPDTGLVLKVYGEERESVGRPRLCIPTRAGTLVLGCGSRVWHERPELRQGERVVAITGCYARSDDAPRPERTAGPGRLLSARQGEDRSTAGPMDRAPGQERGR